MEPFWYLQLGSSVHRPIFVSHWYSWGDYEVSHCQCGILQGRWFLHHPTSGCGPINCGFDQIRWIPKHQGRPGQLRPAGLLHLHYWCHFSPVFPREHEQDIRQLHQDDGLVLLQQDGEGQTYESSRLHESRYKSTPYWNRHDHSSVRLEVFRLNHIPLHISRQKLASQVNLIWFHIEPAQESQWVCQR